MYLQITYAGQLLDFQVTPEKFYFSYSIKSLEDFTKIGGSLTERSISIPATKKNDTLEAPLFCALTALSCAICVIATLLFFFFIERMRVRKLDF